MQWVADLVTRHRVHAYGDEFPGTNPREVWNSGRFGMFVQICVYTNFNQAQFDWDIVPLPKGKTQVTRTASAGHSMTAASKNKDAAWEVLKFLGSKPSYEHWAKLGLTIPTFKEVAESPLVLNPNAPPKSAKIATDAFAYARPEPISGDWGNVGAEISKAMAEVYAGKIGRQGRPPGDRAGRGVPALQDPVAAAAMATTASAAGAPGARGRPPPRPRRPLGRRVPPAAPGPEQLLEQMYVQEVY